VIQQRAELGGSFARLAPRQLVPRLREGGAEPLLAHRLQEEVERRDVEGAQRVTLVGGV